jgi:hypothetical protein
MRRKTVAAATLLSLLAATLFLWVTRQVAPKPVGATEDRVPKLKALVSEQEAGNVPANHVAGRMSVQRGVAR